jgi:protein TonB
MIVKSLQEKEVVALPRSTDVRPNSPAADPSSADLSNVVPFARPRAVRQAPEIPAPEAIRGTHSGVWRERAPFLAFAALSLALHGAALWMLALEPEPLASIGEQVISIEIVVGATAPAGVAQAPGEVDVQAAATEVQEAEPPRETEEKMTEQPQEVPVAAPEEKAPEEKKPEQTETPPETKVAEALKEQEQKPRETSSDPEVALVQPPDDKPPEDKPREEKPPERKAAPKPVHNAAPAKEPRRIDAPTKHQAQKQAKAAPSSAANNVGVGRSDNNSNYAGLVSAHLRRHQRYPPEARSRHEQGTATVTFALDGSGHVTTARLIKGSGIPSIDQEAQAMVRRASPFPPPPSRHAVSFTVPVSFRLN